MAKSIVLLTKQEQFSSYATGIAQALFPDIETFSGKVGDPMPARLGAGADVLISFLSPWIIPARVLDVCGTAINFHPGSVEYPGTGCYNFALYEGAAEFGATCHHMLPKVDTGLVIEERRFPVFAGDTVELLKLRTMATMLALFHDIACLIARGEPLPVAATHWTRRAFTRREMNALKRLTDDMAPGEIQRRIRATVYPGYDGPFWDRCSGIEVVPVPQRAALA
ncbi:MAG: hypothetical protein JSS55_00340 [Proteobacteria bacterium]|nr:hypothetical protein [Pseudomonadota bacterium]